MLLHNFSLLRTAVNLLHQALHMGKHSSHILPLQTHLNNHLGITRFICDVIPFPSQIQGKQPFAGGDAAQRVCQLVFVASTFFYLFKSAKNGRLE
ncbi:hypothetical protein [Paenibacillus thalictri]|uniref:hypothetical protein n=1 Tax=Paenibacillus thalictri TaxID=2527873 RepID=UPI0013EF2BF6|nr:hypothetical protein [Paenibacillus thalictri]